MERNTQVDGLRGILMLMIVLFHLFCRYLQVYCDIYPTILLINRWGILCVAVFFMITGYYLAFEQKGGIQFVLKRICKLWPAYFVAITFVFLVSRIAPLPDRTVSLTDYLWNIPFLNGFLGVSYVDASHWYLTSLVGAILGYSLVLTRKKDTERCIWLIAWLVVAVLLRKLSGINEMKALDIFVSIFAGLYLPMIVAGSAIFYIAKPETRLLGVVLMMVSLVAICIMQQLLFVVVMIAGAMVLAATLYLKLPLLSWRGFVWLGKISYPVYVIHQNLGFICLFYLSAFVGGYHIGLSIAVSLLMVLLGYVLYRWVDIPMRKTAKRIFASGLPDRQGER